MKVTIEQQHIDTGKPTIYDLPIILAMADALPEGANPRLHSASASVMVYYSASDHYERYWLPNDAIRHGARFEIGQTVAPATFDLGSPEKWRLRAGESPGEIHPAACHSGPLSIDSNLRMYSRLLI